MYYNIYLDDRYMEYLISATGFSFDDMEDITDDDVQDMIETLLDNL